MAVKPIPDGYHSVTPYLVVEGADKLLECPVPDYAESAPAGPRFPGPANVTALHNLIPAAPGSGTSEASSQLASVSSDEWH